MRKKTTGRLRLEWRYALSLAIAIVLYRYGSSTASMGGSWYWRGLSRDGGQRNSVADVLCNQHILAACPQREWF